MSGSRSIALSAVPSSRGCMNAVALPLQVITTAAVVVPLCAIVCGTIRAGATCLGLCIQVILTKKTIPQQAAWMRDRQRFATPPMELSYRTISMLPTRRRSNERHVTSADVMLPNAGAKKQKTKNKKRAENLLQKCLQVVSYLEQACYRLLLFDTNSHELQATPFTIPDCVPS